MALSCGSRLAKCILFVFNVVFWLAGACLLGVGIWFLVDDNALNYLDIATADTDEDSVQGAAICLVIIGSVIFITGGFGCLGAVKESTCMLTTYAVILVILLILQVTAGILAVVFRNDILDGLEESMNDTVHDKYGVDEGLTDSWDFMQVELECCGSAGPSDWEHSKWSKNASHPVPDTCCVLSNDDYKDPQPVDPAKCYAAAVNSSMADADQYLHTEGCHEALEDWIDEHAGILIGIAFGLLAVQVIGIILACCLKKNIAGEYQYV